MSNFTADDARRNYQGDRNPLYDAIIDHIKKISVSSTSTTYWISSDLQSYDNDAMRRLTVGGFKVSRNTNGDVEHPYLFSINWGE